MSCHLVTLDKCLRVHLLGKGETLHHTIAKIVRRVAGDQAKTTCSSLQLCAGVEATIEVTTHAVSQRRQERRMLETDGGEDDVSEGAEDKSVAASGET